ncbi:hypothetical protein CCACVL1_09964 [Corchorus capsularis]|uniref:Uncharacterized protein n=1 Tax=Corchorus capsularis TaxID=210143 RepID=A0A1R3ITF7_COCAP|nr:hypothetical protein CCACVL1_09964 [Corchorus capsularis]
MEGSRFLKRLQPWNIVDVIG